MAATGLGLSGASSVRQPEGAGKWFAESRARRALRNAGFTERKEEFCFDYFKGDKRYAMLSPAKDGLYFSLNEKDEALENIAYEFGIVVTTNY